MEQVQLNLLLPPHFLIKDAKGLQHNPGLGDRTEPWGYWPWEQPWDLTPKSRISPGSCLKLWSSGLAAHRTGGFLAKEH